MDLSRLVGLLFLLFLTACITERSQRTQRPPKTYLEMALSPSKVVALSEQYLEWKKGFEVKLRDRQRGLLVTEWIKDIPTQRYQVSLRISPNPPTGSMISAHVITEVLENAEWKDMATDGRQEEALLADLQDYILSSRRSP